MRFVLIVICVLFNLNILNSQTPTVGLIESSINTYNGYTLISPMFCPANNCPTYLIDNCGEVVHQWPTVRPSGLNAYILPDGKLLRAYTVPNPAINVPGYGGGIQLWDFNNSLLWDYQMNDSSAMQHHEVDYLPNGHILVQSVSFHDSISCVTKGRNPNNVTSAGVWSDKIIEINPIYPDSAEVIWQWDSWDHLIQNYDIGLPSYGQPDQHPELLDINYLGWGFATADWLHTNSVDYNPSLDQVVISSRHMSEFYIIDHSTTTSEAMSHFGGNSNKGGDVLYRWGNPEAYGKDVFTNRKLFAQHDVHWIKDGLNDAGKIMVFNNGSARTPSEYSSIDIIDPGNDLLGNYTLNTGGTFDPDTFIWSYLAPNPTDFHAQFISGAERLSDGHTIICDGTHGTIFEIDENKNLIWKYIVPVSFGGPVSQGTALAPFVPQGTANWVFRAPKYGVDYPGFIGQTFVPIGEIELNPYVSTCQFVGENERVNSNEIKAYPNPAIDHVIIQLPEESKFEKLILKDALGVSVINVKILEKKINVDVKQLISGTYFIELITSTGEKKNLKFIKLN